MQEFSGELTVTVITIPLPLLMPKSLSPSSGIYNVSNSFSLVTQLLHQPLHMYKIYKIYTLKH